MSNRTKVAYDVELGQLAQLKLRERCTVQMSHIKPQVMKTVPALAIASAILAGCASNSGVIPLGQSRYMISSQQATGFPGLGNLTAENIAAATAHCAKQGMQFELVNIAETAPPYIFGNYPRSEVRFVCVSEGKRTSNPKPEGAAAQGI